MGSKVLLAVMLGVAGLWPVSGWSLEDVQDALSRNPDPNHMGYGMFGDDTLLMAVAARTNDPAAIRYLLEAGADLEAVGDEGTPVMYALQNPNPAILTELAQAGANVNYQGMFNSVAVTAFNHVPYQEHVEILLDAGLGTIRAFLTTNEHMSRERGEFLLSRGAPIDITDFEGATPLMRSITNPEIVALLLEQGADPNAQDGYGNSALHYATRRYYVFGGQFDAGDPYDSSEVIRLIAAAGGDVNIQNNAGETPLISAAIHNAATAERTVEVLIELGADPSISDATDRRYQDWVLSHGSQAAITLSEDEVRSINERLFTLFTERESAVSQEPWIVVDRVEEQLILSDAVDADPALFSEELRRISLELERSEGNPMFGFVVNWQDNDNYTIVQYNFDSQRLERLNRVRGEYSLDGSISLRPNNDDSIHLELRRRENLIEIYSGEIQRFYFPTSGTVGITNAGGEVIAQITGFL